MPSCECPQSVQGPACRPVQEGRGSCTSGRVKAWAWCESEVSAVVCLEAVTKQFVQPAPGERQLFGALLVGSSTASLHPSPLPWWTQCHSGTAEEPGCLTREGTARECLEGLKGRRRSLQCLSVAFSNGHLSRAAGDSLEEAAGGCLGALLGREVGCEQCLSQRCTQSAAGSSAGCCASLFVSNDSNQGNIFKQTGFCSTVSKQLVLQLLSSEIMWIGSEMILLDAIVQGRASG